MKKVIYFIFLALIVNTSLAQIPNGGFESWTNMGTYENPDSWGTMNNTTASSGIFTATKATPGSPGTAYLKLTSQTIAKSVVNGIAVSGALDSISLQPISGFPFNQRPQSFTGKWQHMIFRSSQGSVSAILTLWNNNTNQRDTIATVVKTLSGMAMSWAPFTFNFTYQSDSFPDSCIIVLKASGANPSQEDYLWVDNLAFAGTVAGIQSSRETIKNIKLFPNPASNQLFVDLQDLNYKGHKMIISDMTGAVIIEKNLNESTFKLNTSNLSNGLYIFKIVNSFNIQLAEGKFAIQH